MKTPNTGISKIASVRGVVGWLNYQRTWCAFLMCFLMTVLVLPASAGTATKAGSGTDLTSAGVGVWTGGSGANGSPTSADVATWTSSSLGTGLTIGSASSWGSINVSASSPAIAITGAGTLTLGSGGITLDTAAGDMSFTNAITLGADQTWNIGSGRTLTTAGAVGGSRTLTKSGLGTLIKTNASDANTGMIILAGTLKGKPCGNSGTLTINSGATWDLSPVNRTVAIIADGTGGGGLITSSSLSAQTLATGSAADTSFSGVLQNGSCPALSINKQNAGKLTLSGVCTFSGAITISAGTLNIGGAGQLGSGSFAGGITFTVGTFSYSSSLPQTLSGNITGPGALTQNGPGTLTLSGTGNNYSGLTTVAGGTMAVSSAQISQAGAISVSDGATLKVNVSTGQIPPSTLTVGSSTGGTLEFNGITSKTTAPINAGTLTINGTTSIKIDNLPATAAVNDSYPLVAYTSGGSGTLTIASLPAGFTGHLTTGSSPIVLVIDTVSSTLWSAGTGNWDTSTTNWTIGGSPTTYADGQKVRFDDTPAGAGPFTVTITPAGVSPASITADNTNKNYTIGGNPITGATTSLAKSGAGTLTLSGANSFGGGMTVSAGTVDLGGGSQSAGGVTLSGGTIQNGTLTGTSYGLQSGTVSAVLAGAVAVSKTTAGDVVLSGPNTYSGGTTLTLGKLRVSATETAGTSGPLGASGTITFGGGTLQYSSANNYDYSSRFGSSPAMNVDLNGQSVTFATTFTGSSSLTVGDSAGGGILTLSSGANGYTGATTINSGTLRGKPGSQNTAALTMNGGTFDLFGTTVVLSTLNGAAGAQIVNNGAACTLHVGVNNPANPGAFAGVIADGTGALSLTTRQTNGTTFTLSGANTFSGITTVTAGGFLKLTHSLALQNSSLPSGSAAGIVFDSSVSSHAFIFGNLVGAGNLTLQDNAGSPNNVALSVGNNNVSATYSGILSGGGSLTKIGTGRWILNGTNTYTGVTVVSNGNLWIDGGIVSSTTVKTNATLGGTGSIGGAVVVEAGGTLYPGFFGAGTLTLNNNLTLNATSTNSFVVATNGVLTNFVAVAGLLTPNTSIIQVTSGTPLAPGIYSNLFTYGTISGSFNSTLIFDVAPAGTPSLLDDGSGHINLKITSTFTPSTNALLASLVITPAGILAPTFTSSTTSYAATNAYTNNQVQVTASSVDTNAMMSLTLNGTPAGVLINGVAGTYQTLTLNPPMNTLVVTVVSQDLSQTNIYTVNVLLEPSQTMPTLTNSVIGSTLTLAWPADHLGYRLLVQTNNLTTGVSSNTNDWGTVLGSQSITTTNISIINNGVMNEYYRLVYP